MKPKQLKVTKKELFIALKTMLKSYKDYEGLGQIDKGFKKIMGKRGARGYVLKQYDDFYEWLQGRN